MNIRARIERLEKNLVGDLERLVIFREIIEAVDGKAVYPSFNGWILDDDELPVFKVLREAGEDDESLKKRAEIEVLMFSDKQALRMKQI